jgi:AraC-like DNA-binding protein
MREPGSSDHPGTATDPRNSRRLIEIALEVGYTSPSYFARVFRREVGVTPPRARHQGNLFALVLKGRTSQECFSSVRALSTKPPDEVEVEPG